MISRLDTIKDWAGLAVIAGYCALNLARYCGVSGRQLQRVFILKMGMTPQAWLDTLRQSRAMDLLGRAKSVKEVAFELGYKQPSHFSREFKRVHGVCPKSARSLVNASNVAGGYEMSSTDTGRVLNESHKDALIMLHEDKQPPDKSVSAYSTKSAASKAA